MAKVVLALTLLAVANASIIRKLTPAQAERLANWNGEENQNIWEVSGQFEGDMILSDKQRNGIIPENYRWPNKTVPYVIDARFTADQKTFIEIVFRVFQTLTCIKTIPRTDEVDYVHISGEYSGCWSQVGRQGSVQKLNLQPTVLGMGCMTIGNIQHQLLHTLGFFHQHNAYDRDNYIDIKWDNIDERELYNFEKLSINEATNFGERYDYASVMHYSEFAKTGNGLRTIIPKDPKAEIGKQFVSGIDLNKLRKMYGC